MGGMLPRFKIGLWRFLEYSIAIELNMCENAWEGYILSKSKIKLWRIARYQ
jgi:hypothetical protein